MILAAIVIAKNPAQYGFDFEPEMPLAYEKVQVSDPIDLRLVAEWTNAPIDDIEALNPELRRWTTPVRSPNYEIKVPVGTGDAFRARLAETPRRESQRVPVAFGEARRNAAVDLAEAESAAGRSGRGEFADAALARAGRASSSSFRGRRRRCSPRGRRIRRPKRWSPNRGPSCPQKPTLAAARRRRRHGRAAAHRAPRQARRHALLHREALQHHDRLAEILEHTHHPRQSHQHRRSPDDLRHPRGELVFLLCLTATTPRRWRNLAQLKSLIRVTGSRILRCFHDA